MYLENLTVRSFLVLLVVGPPTDPMKDKQYQSRHLNALAQSKFLLIPVDIRSTPTESTEGQRRLIAALKLRDAQSDRPRRQGNRFMEGPEPSWLAKKKVIGEA